MERVETINQRLKEYFGKDDRNEPIWRVVWSDEQLEKQLLAYTPEGFELITPRWYTVPKYKMMGIHSRYILERLVTVPVTQAHELTQKLSYEPMWTFQDKFGNAVAPVWEAIELIINTVYAAQGKKTGEVLYHDEEKGMDKKELVIYHANRIKKIQDDLFGNETDTGDALAYREGVTVPSNYEKKQ